MPFKFRLNFQTTAQAHMKYYICYLLERSSSKEGGLLVQPVSLTDALRQHPKSDYSQVFEDLDKLISGAADTLSRILVGSENRPLSTSTREQAPSYGTFG